MAAAARHPEPPSGRVSASRQTALLYERHRRRLLGLCRSRLDCRADAEDALQQTFVYALRCLDRGVVPQNEVAWLNTIAENVCRAWTRNGARRTRRETEAEVERLPELRSDADRVSDARDLAAALAVLPFAQRRALLLREWQGLSYREVAAELATTESAVETLIFRARRRAAAALTDARRLLDVGTPLAGLRKALGALGAKGGAVAAAGCVTVAAAVPLARTIRPPRHATPPAPATTHVQLLPTHVSPVVRAVRTAAKAPRVQERARRPARKPSVPAVTAVQVTAAAAPTVPQPTVEAPPAADPPSAPDPTPAPAQTGPAPAPVTPPSAEPTPTAPPTATAAAVDAAVQTVGSAADTVTTAVGSAVDTVTSAIPGPPPLPAPSVPLVAAPSLP